MTARNIQKMLQLGAWVTISTIFAAIFAISSDRSTGAPVATPVSAKPAEAEDSVQFTVDGKLLRPTGYRKWIYVGTPLTPHDMNDGKAAFPEFHAVYINPKAFERFEATNEFPDGTVLVKELVSVGSKRATSGKGYFMGDFIGLEVSIKDEKRFPDEPGHWAFFSFGHRRPLSPTAAVQPTANCNTCHGGAADDDYVFTQYYPVLGATKKD